METILEEQRRLAEERERVIDVITKEMVRKKNVREQINSEHACRALLDVSKKTSFNIIVHNSMNLKRYYDSTQNYLRIMDDQDGSRKKEIQSLSGPNEFTEFYTRLKTILQYHKKNPSGDGTLNVPLSVELNNFVKSVQGSEDEPLALVNFTDEEGYGKYLDLNECYQRFVNIKGIERIEYLKYLSQYDHMFAISREKKVNPDYKRYLESLYNYLHNYLQRVKPLFDIDGELKLVEVDFEKRWGEGTFPGWPKEASGALTKSGAYLELSAYSSWEELASLGLDRLKSALMALGLKCGGTLEERAIRLFQTKGKRLQDLDPSLFAKAQNNQSKKSIKEYTEKHKEIGLIEAKIYRFSELLSEQRASTLENVQRKQARTGDERDEEDDEEVEIVESDEDNDVIYNPKNLPLGWDGKPIPYWLYKLHGLNLYYNCEICGNYKYRGPKAYQKHFSEWRHAHGMRCLGIPNTAHFANITLIEDAVTLWEKLKVIREQERFRPENEEECEDASGNIFNRKTHDDLRRQGLL